MNDTKIIEMIGNALPSMPPVYRKIAVYILENPNSAGFLSIYNFSERVGVSTASIVRFTKFLGLEGYSELKRVLQSHMQVHIEPAAYGRLSTIREPADNPLYTLFASGERENLERTLTACQPDLIDQIVSRISACNKIFISGFNLYSHVMELFSHSFRALVPQEVAMIGGAVVDYSFVLNRCGQDDLLLAFDFPPYAGEIRHIVTTAKNRGCTVVLFTDSLCSPSYTLADLRIHCETNARFQSNSFVGLVAMMQIIINVLYSREKETIIPKVHEAMSIVEEGYKLAGMATSFRP